MRKRIRALIDRKVEGGEIKAAPEARPQAKVIDLMAALKASLARKGGKEGRRREKKAKGKRSVRVPRSAGGRPFARRGDVKGKDRRSRNRRSSPSRTAGRRRVRYAVVGLGWIAQESILPAFAKARANSELHALVSDDPGKLRVLGRKYGVTNLYSYDDYERCLREVDAVFIALPNSLHREFTERAARAKVHVLCEKPMAVTEQDARAMQRACDRAGVKLMIAYRLHFERATLTAIDAVRKGRVGDPRFFQSSFAMKAEPGNLRLRPGEGGALYDIGVYCLNAARNVFGSEPVEAFGEHVRGKGARFRHAPEATAAVLRFPGERIASFTSSFGAEGKSAYEVFGTKGTLRMAPAYSHSDRLTLQVTRNGDTKIEELPGTGPVRAGDHPFLRRHPEQPEARPLRRGGPARRSRARCHRPLRAPPPPGQAGPSRPDSPSAEGAGDPPAGGRIAPAREGRRSPGRLSTAPARAPASTRRAMPDEKRPRTRRIPARRTRPRQPRARREAVPRVLALPARDADRVRGGPCDRARSRGRGAAG